MWVKLKVFLTEMAKTDQLLDCDKDEVERIRGRVSAARDILDFIEGPASESE